MMKWEKLGKIFDPADHVLPSGCSCYAQSPQALVFADYIRVYFSTRSIDSDHNYLSHIAFADFSKDFKEIIHVSKSTVIPLGDLGTFDEHGIFPISPYKDGDIIVAYTCGWSRRVSVPVETSIGYVISNDGGLTFQRIGPGPILSCSPKEPVLVGDGFVKKFGNLYYMWYIFGKPWLEKSDNEPPARVYKITFATSKDGLVWEKNDGHEIIESLIDDNECQALPTVIEAGDMYHMIFCYRYSSDFRTNVKRGYRLGYAYSKDLQTWTRDDKKLNLDISPSDWDSEMMCYPHLLEVDNTIYLLYNGNNFGKDGFGAAKLIQL